MNSLVRSLICSFLAALFVVSGLNGGVGVCGFHVIPHSHVPSGIALRLHPDQAPDLERYANELFKAMKPDLEQNEQYDRLSAQRATAKMSTDSGMVHSAGPLAWCRRVVFKNDRGRDISMKMNIKNDKMP